MSHYRVFKVMYNDLTEEAKQRYCEVLNIPYTADLKNEVVAFCEIGNIPDEEMK